MKHVVSSLACALAIIGGAHRLCAQTPLDDPLDDHTGWKVITPEGVTLAVDTAKIDERTCLRLDYHFVTGGGYCILRKEFATPIELPENYAFTFDIKGQGPQNNLELKLIDQTGENVWWINRRAYEWPVAWTRIINPKRRFEFAWGPSAGAPLKSISAVEFAIASSAGGKGSVWIDALSFRALPLPNNQPLPTPDLYSFHVGSGERPIERPSMTFTLGSVREFGAIEIEWTEPPESCTVDLFDATKDCKRTLLWSTTAPIVGTRTLVLTPDASADMFTITRHGKGDSSVGIKSVRLREPSFGESWNNAFAALAQEAPRGSYPKYFLHEASYWTVIGAPDSTEEALINEEGQVEVGKRLFSIEPLLRVDGRLLTWADGTHTQALAEGSLPIASVERTHDNARLRITAFTHREDAGPWLMLRYDLTNTTQAMLDTSLVLAIRPLQVNPTWQRLNFEGGSSPIRHIEGFSVPDGPSAGRIFAARVQAAAGTRDVHALSGTPGFGVVASDTGDVRDYVAEQIFRKKTTQADGGQNPGGAFMYPLTLNPGETFTCALAVPMFEPSSEPPRPRFLDITREQLRQFEDECARMWRDSIGSTALTLPEADRWIAETFRSQLAYILLNRDGPALQPGSRSYERSWARDGSLTSSALLACGLKDQARRWIDWYATHIFDNGKVPCVVDHRGPDPVPEHDSHGQYIWAVANDHRHTHDDDFAKQHWPRVQRVVAYIQSLRAQRMTPEYAEATDPTERAMFGLVPESISHEGYSAKPMHSYWDDFFVLLGFKEAAYLAGVVGDATKQAEYAKLVDEFRGHLYDSMRRVFAHRNIDYIPGCVELADFDATSTTIALSPCGEATLAPQPQLRNTFEKYWEFAKGRIDGASWEGMTPYEHRCVGALVRLGERERAYELLRWLGSLRRPPGWNHWAEVVWKDSQTPKFIGDMPHTWVGSDFVSSVLSMFVHEEQTPAGESLVLFAGVPKAWIDSGQPIGIENVHTHYGMLTLSMRRLGNRVIATVARTATPTTPLPPGGIILRAPPGALEGDETIQMPEGPLPAGVTWTLRTRE